MSLVDSIKEAKNRGASDDVILQEIIKQNPDRKTSFDEAKKRGADSSRILNEIVNQTGGISQPVRTKTQPKIQQEPTMRSFLKSELMGGATEEETPQGGVGGFVSDLFKETVGSKGLLGATQMPGRVVESLFRSKDEQKLYESRDNLSNSVLLLTKEMQKLPEGERKEKMKKLIASSNKEITNLNTLIKENEQRIMKPEEALATSTRAAATLIGGGGKTLAQQSIRAGIAGAGYGVSGGIEEKASPEELLKRGVVGGAIGVLTPGAMRVGKAIVQKAVVKPLKGLSNAVSRFFFGPEGTTGFAVRFEDPNLSGFLRTAQRKPGGTQLEDITTMLHGAVRGVRDKMKNQFAAAEEKLVEKPIVRKTVVETVKKNITDFLRIDKATANEVARSGMDDTQVRVVNRILKEVSSLPKNTTTKDILSMRRMIDTLYKGTQNTKQSDAIVSKITNYLNSLIKAVDKDFAKVSEGYAADSKFLSLLQKNVIGTAKGNVEQTANNLFTLAKQLDNPFKKEASQKLLSELSKRSGIDFIKILRGLAAAENLSPQQSLGIRAGITREIARMLQVGLSNIIGVAGKVSQKMPEIPQNILEKLSTGAGTAERVGTVKTVESLFNK
jgi:hypothetical protein